MSKFTHLILHSLIIASLTQICSAFRRCPALSPDPSYGDDSESEVTVQAETYMRVTTVTAWVGHSYFGWLDDQFNLLEFTLASLDHSTEEVFRVGA